MRLKDVHASWRNLPDVYWESFEELNNLYTDGSFVTIGYRGNLYKASIAEHSTSWFRDPSYQIDTRYKIGIWDFMNHKIVGTGSFSVGYPRSSCYDYNMSQIRVEIRKAIIRANMKPTDFYE